ncbi:predicted protein [Streptomyces iranensis]|uniref:Uncharacterized protein n=1 Tax=Streptomyces iranensis TaxID=576784 RepID=A0A060ZBN5_9ACTN|nr:predicted protein [Streptomyces iranensis]
MGEYTLFMNATVMERRVV